MTTCSSSQRPAYLSVSHFTLGHVHDVYDESAGAARPHPARSDAGDEREADQPSAAGERPHHEGERPLQPVPEEEQSSWWHRET